MRFRLLKFLTPLLQPVFRIYLSRIRSYRYKGVRVRVRPGVFFPGFLFSTKILLQFIDKLDLDGKTLLELGAGSGLISVYAGSKGAIVTASDINPISVKNIRENAALNRAEITVIESDLFDGIPKVDFDYIIIAPPYYPKDPRNMAEIAWYCGKNFEYFEKLFKQVGNYFNSRGMVLMILSEDCDIGRIAETGTSNGFSMNELHREKRFGEWSYIFRISGNTTQDQQLLNRSLNHVT